jgi:hypothetical protein
MNDGEFTPEGEIIPSQENWDSPEGIQARVASVQSRIRNALKEFDCVLRIPRLHIGTGTIIPELEVTPATPQPKSPNIINPNSRR